MRVDKIHTREMRRRLKAWRAASDYNDDEARTLYRRIAELIREVRRLRLKVGEERE